MSFKKVDPKISFPKLEEKIIEQWKTNGTFKKSIKSRDLKDAYVFYDGPPFATGLPHYGHILAGTIKDVVPRYWTMKGKRIERRFGWDCHGLPIENIVEDELKLSSKNDILEKVGIKNFNQKCRSCVLKYTSEWEKTVERMGRWVDFDDDYKTMDSDFMESIWWVFKSLWEKGLIYEGMKPMHVCPRCSTPLSNFEVTQGYKDIVETSVIVKFKLISEKNTYLLAWTTTPWTLPGNILLAVNQNIEYSKVEFAGNYYILAKEKIEETFKNKEFKIIEDVEIKNLIGQKYEPIFDSLKDLTNGFRVVHAPFVNTEEGVGVVHCAGPYGEEDMNLCIQENIELKHHVNIDGTFKEIVREYAGEDCKKMDKKIIHDLKAKDIVFNTFDFKHAYPHCWRCETPLLNYATSSWFVKVTAIKDDLIKNNQKINWVPGHIKEGRFGKWLEGAKDWAISRARFWGTPLPIWKSTDGDIVCIGSIQELEKLSGKKIGDLHKDIVDEIEINLNGKLYKRIPEVLDCWFESGSMPYSERHFPFSEVPELKNEFYLIRHGESLCNTNGNFSTKLETSKNYPLTQLGKDTVENSAELLEQEKIDLIYSSDFFRTKETAEIIASKLGKEVFLDERLREIRVEELDGVDYNECEKIWPKKIRLHYPYNATSESYINAQTRMLDLVRELNEKYTGKRILLVSHGAPLKMLQAAFKGLNKEDLITSDYPKKGEFFKLERNPAIRNFASVFPAEFIAEGQDQTRGWFYTLMVLSTALFNQPAFKNVIVNGIVLAEDGKKMSKRLKNYPDPHHIFDNYGADALRFYLIKSPVVRADDLRFSEKGVSEVVKSIILPLWNAYSFFVTYANIDNFSKKSIQVDFSKLSNPLDLWIISRLEETLLHITNAMDKYDLQKSTELETFIDDLTNWYIRRSRRRFWKSENDHDKLNAYETLHYVLVKTAQMIAPIMPFISEEIYQNLTAEESVHLSNWPETNHKLINSNLNQEIDILRRIVKLGHAVRARKKIKVRQPLNKIEVGIENYSRIENLDLEVIKQELNIKEVFILKDSGKLAKKVILPNAKLIGPKYGSKVQEIIQKAKNGEYKSLENSKIQVGEFILEEFEYEIRFIANTGFDVESDHDIVVSLDTEITPDLIKEGNARDLIRAIQDLRKERNLNVDDRITIIIEEKAANLFESFDYLIKKETLATQINFQEEVLNGKIIEIDEHHFNIDICKD